MIMKNWSRSEEFLLGIDKPEATDTYSPIAHEIFVAELQELLYKKGMEVVSKKYLVDSKGQTMAGEYMINNHIDNEMTISIGFQNSYNKTVKAGINCGALVLVCKNGMYRSEGSSYHRKHTGCALEDIRRNIDLVVSESEEQLIRLIAKREQMKLMELSNARIAALIGDMYLNEGLINTSHLEIIKREMSSSKDFKERTVWSLYNWTTEAFKDAHPTTYLKKHLMLHTYICDKLGLTEGRSLYGMLEDGMLTIGQPRHLLAPGIEETFGPLLAHGEFADPGSVSLDGQDAGIIMDAMYEEVYPVYENVENKEAA
jgi:hypothetical protein